MIKHCLQEPSYIGYTHAQGLLRQRYGDPHIVLASYRKEVRNWPKLTFGDAKGFRLFFNFLVKCDGVAREQNWNAINTPDVICMLVSKLPNALIDRWNRIAYNIRKKHECEPNLSDLIEFVDQETTLVNDPMFSRQAIEGFNGKSEKQPEKRNRRLKTLATEAVEEKCPICSSNHDIDECEDLKKLTVDERSKVFFKKKLCYGCCKPINDGHNSKTCKKRRKCKHCEGTHPTVLHGFKIKSKERSKQGKDGKESAEGENRSASVNCASSRMNLVISMCVVPVKVRIKGSQGAVKRWAMLDNCSQESFVKTNLLEELEVSGIRTSVTIRTLNKDYKHSTIAADGLEVTNVDEEEGEWIKLPTVFSQDDLSAASDEIATADNIQKWQYLHKIIPKMKNFDGQGA